MKKLLLLSIIVLSISCSNNNEDPAPSGDGGSSIGSENSGGGNITCYKPVNLEVQQTTSNSTTYYWHDTNNAQLFNIEYGPRGFSLGNGTKKSSSKTQIDISNLIPNTEYDFYVRANCGGNDYSEWSNPHSFITKPSNSNGFIIGEYRIEQITTAGNNGPILSDGTIIKIQKNSNNDKERRFDTRFFPENCSQIRTFIFELRPNNNTIYVPLIKSDCSCNSNYFFGPAKNDSTYDPNNDTEFYIKFTDDVYDDCGTNSPVQITYKFTKV